MAGGSSWTEGDVMKKIIDELLCWYQEVEAAYGKPDQDAQLLELKKQIDKDNTVTNETFLTICETMAMTCMFWNEVIVEQEELDKRIYIKIPVPLAA